MAEPIANEFDYIKARMKAIQQAKWELHGYDAATMSRPYEPERLGPAAIAPVLPPVDEPKKYVADDNDDIWGAYCG